MGDWLYRVAAGIEIDECEPGYKHILFQPRPGGGLEYARASLETMFGCAGCAWKIEGHALKIEVEVPPNTTATLRIPACRLDDVTESGLRLKDTEGILKAAQEGKDTLIRIGSGRYEFLKAK